jgi:hypothetical protein
MSILSEFREFALKGNVVDLAIGVIIGAAFNGIVQSLVNDIVMPPIGLATGGMDFAALEWVLQPARVENGEDIAARLRQIHQRHDQLPDRRLGAVSGDQGDERDEAKARGQTRNGAGKAGGC